MLSNELQHHGILGQKWGKRNGPPYPLTKSARSSAEKKASGGGGESESNERSSKKSKTSSKKNVRDMTDEELNAAIRRLELEKKYSDLTRAAEQKKVRKGKKMMADILENSAKNVGGQLAVYGMATAANKILQKSTGSKEQFVNPKKGQKDK